MGEAESFTWDWVPHWHLLAAIDLPHTARCGWKIQHSFSDNGKHGRFFFECVTKKRDVFYRTACSQSVPPEWSIENFSLILCRQFSELTRFLESFYSTKTIGWVFCSLYKSISRQTLKSCELKLRACSDLSTNHQEGQKSSQQWCKNPPEKMTKTRTEVRELGVQPAIITKPNHKWLK